MKLFLSYRRDDSAYIVGRLRDRLVQHFGEDSIFTDVDNIPLGANFVKQIDSHVAQCDVLLVAIGADWLTIIKRRQDDSKDFVRIEIESALKRNIPVIPLLMRDGSVPKEDELPPSLRELASRQGIPIRRDPDFHRDVDRLIKGLDQHGIANEPNDKPRVIRRLGALGLVLVVVGIAGVTAWNLGVFETNNTFERQVSEQGAKRPEDAGMTAADRSSLIGNRSVQIALQAKKSCEGADGIVAIRAFAISVTSPGLLADYIHQNAAAFAGENRAIGCLTALMAKAEVNRAADPSQIDLSTDLLLSVGPTFTDTIRGISDGRIDVETVEGRVRIKDLLDGNAKSSTILANETQMLIHKWRQQNELQSNLMKSLHDMAMTPIRNMR